MLTEPLVPLLIRTALPTMLGMLVGTIYSLTDTFWIGLMNNTDMTAAVGVVFPFISFVQAVGFWFGYGSGNVMARRLGENKAEEAEKTSSLGVFLAASLGIILAAVCLLPVQPTAEFLGGGGSPALLEQTASYLVVISAAIPFQLISVTVYNQLRLCGNVRDGMIGMGVGMFGNIILDPVFILGCNMGVSGAGLATSLGQIASCIVLFIISGKHGNIPLRFFGFDLKDRRLYHILLGGAPNFSRQSITSIATILLNKAAEPYGTALIAAITVSSRVSAVAYMLMIGFGQGFQPICAMNCGAKQYDRVRKAFRLTVTIGTVFLTAAGALLAVFAEPVTSAFASDDPEVVEKAVTLVRLQCISFPFLSFLAVSGMYMQNVGMYIRSLLISISRQGIVFIPLLFILPAVWQEWGLYVLQPAADIVSFYGRFVCETGEDRVKIILFVSVRKLCYCVQIHFHSSSKQFFSNLMIPSSRSLHSSFDRALLSALR